MVTSWPALRLSKCLTRAGPPHPLVPPDSITHHQGCIDQARLDRPEIGEHTLPFRMEASRSELPEGDLELHHGSVQSGDRSRQPADPLKIRGRYDSP